MFGQAMGLVNGMWRSQLELHVISNNANTSACENGTQYGLTLKCSAPGWRRT